MHFPATMDRQQGQQEMQGAKRKHVGAVDGKQVIDCILT
jgi:hypothetical protein